MMEARTVELTSLVDPEQLHVMDGAGVGWLEPLPVVIPLNWGGVQWGAFRARSIFRCPRGSRLQLANSQERCCVP